MAVPPATRPRIGASFTVSFDIVKGASTPRRNTRSPRLTVAIVAFPCPCAIPPSTSKALRKSAPSIVRSRALAWSVMTTEASSTASCFRTIRRGTAAAAAGGAFAPARAEPPSFS